MRRALLVLVTCLATGAHADVWQRAIDGPEAVDDRYQLELQNGDELVLRANGRGQSKRMVLTLIDQALRAYRAAAALRPAEAEPYFRIASALEGFFIDCGASTFPGLRPPPTCTPGTLDVKRAHEALAAWDAFEARAPLDPRLAESLFNRAILRTKLATDPTTAKPMLEAAARDYQAMIDRADGIEELYERYTGRLTSAWGNLAETYMMLGRPDEAIAAYQTALQRGGSSSVAYGLAVALDRDERGAQALEVIRRQPPSAFRDYLDDLAMGNIFYVPRGEEFYYIALIEEALGLTSDAIQHWRLFIRSGAHPQYQPRAKAHLDALLAKQKANPRLLPSPAVLELFR